MLSTESLGDTEMDISPEIVNPENHDINKMFDL